MKCTLPVSKVDIELFDYMPQIVYEKSQEALLAGMAMNISMNVTDDDILEAMGADFLHEMNTAPKEQKDKMRTEAIQSISAKQMDAKFKLEDHHKSNRIKVEGMIKECSFPFPDDRKDFLGNLCKRDYQFILDKIAEIEDKEEEEGKASDGE